MRSEARSSEESSRDPPIIPDIPGELVYVPLEDVSWEQYENSWKKFLKNSLIKKN